MMGTMRSSSTSSSARAVRLGSPPGIGLLMKWITCDFTVGAPVVDGGRDVCARARPMRLAKPYPARCAL